jgi:peptidoglycan/xylan/chitin deacetylase (PgdA/CDA1 family)
LLLILIVIAVLALFVLYWLFLSPYSQIFGYFPYKVKTDKKVIAITFDDGPNEPYTSQLIDFLDSKNAKATFFIVGENANKNPRTLKKMIKSGHSIGAHSINHKFSNYLLHPNYKEQIHTSKQIIFDISGKDPDLFRPPWLWRHPLIFKQLREAGLKPVSGIFCSNLEVFKPSPSYTAKIAAKKAKPGRIIIFHDGYNNKGTNRQKSIDAVKIFVNSLSNKGYKFITVEELFKLGG